MKNNNEFSTNEETLHEELCAYVLGELEGDASQRVEARLADDPELRAEKERIEATIGLVTTHCSSPESLSLPNLEALDREVDISAPEPGRSGRVSYWGMPLQAAAGFAALAAGLLAGKVLMKGNEGPIQSSPTSQPVAVMDLGEPAAKQLGSEVRSLQKDATPGEVASNKPRLEAVSEEAGPGDLNPEPVLADKEVAEAQAPDQPEVKAVTPGTSTTLALDGAVAAYQPPVPVTKVEPALPGRERAGAPPTEPFRFSAKDSWALGRGVKPTAPPGAAQPNAGIGNARQGYLGVASSGPAGAPAVPPGAQVLTVTGGQDPALGKIRYTAGLEALQPPGTPPASAGTQLGLLFRGEAAKQKDGAQFFDLSRGMADVEALRSMGYAGDDSEEAIDQDFDGGDLFRAHSWNQSLGQPVVFDVEAESARRAELILGRCVRQPNESPSDMFFRFWGDNPFEHAGLDPKSTFSVDVDTASYALARRYLNEGHLPQKAQIRTEEFVNYFPADLPAPTEGTFGIHTELAPSRYGQGADAQGTRWMLRVGVRARDVIKEERKALALTFVVDTSGSMRDGNRMELVKHALRLLLSQLDAGDSIAIVGFNNSATLHLPMTSAQNRAVIEAAIHALHPDGGTNAEGGLRLGYEIAASALTRQAHNRVVLLSDGVANIGQVDQNRINDDVRERRESGIFLNTIGVGMGNHNDTFLEQLANKGDGLCNYVDSPAEARRALVDNFVGAFEAVARDVKIQVEFDPAQVYRYRLLGYENRAIADSDFRNDAVDAGEVGAGHQVVALYELELTGQQAEGNLARVNLRWKAPSGAERDPLEDAAQEISVAVAASSGTAWEGTSTGYRRSVLVAQFAEILRRSVHARGDSLDELLADSQAVATLENQAEFQEFVSLLQRSRSLIVQQASQHSDLSACVDALRRNRILRAQLEDLQRENSEALLKELQATNADLEQRIRDLIRKELEGNQR